MVARPPSLDDFPPLGPKLGNPSGALQAPVEASGVDKHLQENTYASVFAAWAPQDHNAGVAKPWAQIVKKTCPPQSQAKASTCCWGRDSNANEVDSVSGFERADPPGGAQPQLRQLSQLRKATAAAPCTSSPASSWDGSSRRRSADNTASDVKPTGETAGNFHNVSSPGGELEGRSEQGTEGEDVDPIHGTASEPSPVCVQSASTCGTLAEACQDHSAPSTGRLEREPAGSGDFGMPRVAKSFSASEGGPAPANVRRKDQRFSSSRSSPERRSWPPAIIRDIPGPTIPGRKFLEAAARRCDSRSGHLSAGRENSGLQKPYRPPHQRPWGRFQEGRGHGRGCDCKRNFPCRDHGVQHHQGGNRSFPSNSSGNSYWDRGVGNRYGSGGGRDSWTSNSRDCLGSGTSGTRVPRAAEGRRALQEASQWYGDNRHRLADVSEWLWATPDHQAGTSLLAVPVMVQGPDGEVQYVPWVPWDPAALIRAALQYQIEYYFSDGNLVQDVYLRSHMDSQGFVSISVISKFNKIRCFLVDHAFILDSVRQSQVVEVQGEGIRRCQDWQNWLLPGVTAVRSFSGVATASQVSSEDTAEFSERQGTSFGCGSDSSSNGTADNAGSFDDAVGESAAVDASGSIKLEIPLVALAAC